MKQFTRQFVQAMAMLGLVAGAAGAGNAAVVTVASNDPTDWA